MATTIRRHHHRRRPQRPGDRRIPGAAGRKALVLERRELVGGCAVTEEIWPGYRVSTAAYLTSLLQERIVRELELPRFGYRVDAKDPAFFSAFPDGRHFFMWQDRARTLAEIARFSRSDAEAYPAYEDAAGAPAAGGGRPAAHHAAAVSAARARRFPRLPEARRPAARSWRPRIWWRWSRSSPRAPPNSWTSGSNPRR